jgi:PAS domain S-box-containing protein
MLEFDKQAIRNKYSYLFEHPSFIIYVHDLKGNFLDVNDNALKTIGYKREELKDISFKDLANKDALIKAFKRLKRIAEKDKLTKPTEFKIKRKDGKIVYVETFGIPLKKEGNVYAILGVARDITLQKISKQRLKASEEKYRHLFESSPNSINLLNSEGYVIDSNEATNNFLMIHNRNDLIGKHYSEIFSFFEENKQLIPLFKEHFEKTLAGETTELLELPLKRSIGKTRWASFQSSLIKIDNKTVIQYIIRDITERKEAEELIIEEIRKLKALDKIRKDLISRVSHELKTPIMSISVSAELLLQLFKTQIGKDAIELLEIVDRNVKRLMSLIDNLLDTSKIEFSGVDLHIEQNNLSSIIKENVYDLFHFIKKRDLQLELNLPDEFPIKVDRIRIGQVITNLISNAIKNTPPKGKIMVELNKKDYFAEIIVKDTGVGFTKKELNQIFTRFGKIERYGKGLEYIDIQGSGLGLFISKEIIELHSGEIFANSPGRDKGSIFTVKIPLNLD